jgi:hypothetical protein
MRREFVILTVNHRHKRSEFIKLRLPKSNITLLFRITGFVLLYVYVASKYAMLFMGTRNVNSINAKAEAT